MQTVPTFTTNLSRLVALGYEKNGTDSLNINYYSLKKLAED